MLADPRKQPLTADIFNRHILPQLKSIIIKSVEEAFDTKFDQKFEEKIRPFEEKMEEYHQEVVGFKEEVMGEIKNLRDEVAITTGQYQRVDKRVTRVEDHLQLPPIGY